jgi:hypothetical protein
MARGRVYTIYMDAVAVSVTQDLFTIQAAAGIPLEIHAVALSQKTLTAWEAKDIGFKYVPATVTLTGGTAVTPTSMLPGDVAASTTCRTNSTTLATSSGSIRTVLADDFNFLNGFYWSAAGDDDRIIVKGGDAFTVRLGTAPSAAMTVSGWVSFAELV